MAFSFGTPPASSTPAFNFSPSSAPAFGASGAGLAKTSSTPLFGATTTTTTTAFGAAPTPGLFGSSSAPTFSFGGAQPAATQPSLFGAAQPAAAPAASPFSFGGGFGAAPAAQPAAGLFGQPATQQQQQQQAGAISPFGFGAPGGAAAPQVPDDSALKELQSVKDAYVAGPANHRYRFQYLFLNKVDNPAARVKPADVDELAWREALRRAGGEHNPDNLWPVAAHGFQDLLQRKAAQDAAMREHEERLERLQQMVAALAQRQQAVLREQLDGVKRRHAELCKQLLRVLRYIDALEGRFAHAMGHRSCTPRDLLQRLSSQLEAVEAAVAPGAAAGLQGKAEALLAAARLRAGGAGGGAADLEPLVDAASLEAVFSILSGYAEALAKMHQVAQRDARDVGVMQAGGA